MEGFSKFRTALGGFNRSDVSSYISSSARDAQDRTRELIRENARLLEENAALRQEAVTLRADMTDYRDLQSQAARQAEADRQTTLNLSQARDRAQAAEQALTDLQTKVRDYLAAQAVLRQQSAAREAAARAALAQALPPAE